MLVQLLEPNISFLGLPELLLPVGLSRLRCLELVLLAGLDHVRQQLFLGELVPTLEVEHGEDLVQLDNLNI